MGNKLKMSKMQTRLDAKKPSAGKHFVRGIGRIPLNQNCPMKPLLNFWYCKNERVWERAMHVMEVENVFIKDCRKHHCTLNHLPMSMTSPLWIPTDLCLWWSTRKLMNDLLESLHENVEFDAKIETLVRLLKSKKPVYPISPFSIITSMLICRINWLHSSLWAVQFRLWWWQGCLMSELEKGQLWCEGQTDLAGSAITNMSMVRMAASV